MAIIQTIGFTFGTGSGNAISRTLGAMNRKKAEQITSTAFFSVFIIGLGITGLGLLFLDELVYVLGATDSIAPYAKDYARYILLAAPFMCCCYVMNNVLRAQGQSFYSMIGIASGGILNMILDPLLIFAFKMSISGAAIATAFSQFVSFCILLYQCNSREEHIHVDWKNFTFDIQLYKEILTAGSPTFFRQGTASISSIILNLAAKPFGDAAIAAMSIVTRYMNFINSSLIGFGQGFQPVCGFNYGAKRYNRVLEAFYFCVKVAVVLLTTLGVITFIFSTPIIQLFRKDDLEVITIGAAFLRYQAMCLPLQSWIIMVNMMTQLIGYSFRASLVAMARSGICLIPALLTLPKLYGLFGLQLCQPFSDVVSFFLATLVILSVLKELKQLK